jgi:hypothetical protein
LKLLKLIAENIAIKIETTTIKELKLIISHLSEERRALLGI